MKKLVTAIILMLVCNVLLAQKGSVTGHVIDSAEHKGIPLATVTVFNANDTSIVTYRLSNDKGDFKISGLPLDHALRVIVTCSGFDAYRKEFTLTPTQPDLTLDSILMLPTAKLLEDVVVIAERPPVLIKNDTIEFNAASFKTLPNALVEDLLKKLPGVQVDADGNITVNGKPVNRLLVDGKNFFGNDPKMATRNLPANVIDKVQVTDDKEELLRSGDDNINNVGKVVNITLKKGIKKGIFGKVYAGGGTDGRYEAGGIANMFRDTLQVSVLGYSNSLNKPGFGFSELMQAGGLERSNSNLNNRSISIWNSSSGGSSVSVNGINFGGLQSGGGVATSSGAGININHAPSAKQAIFGQYFYGNVKVDKFTSTNIRQYNNDTVVTNNTAVDGDVITNAHNFALGGKLKPDSVTNIQGSISYTVGMQDEVRTNIVSSVSNILGPLSNGSIGQINEANTYLYKHSINYNRLSKTKKGRRLTLFHNYESNNGKNNYTTNALTSYIYPTPYDTLLQQLRNERIPRKDAVAGIIYREPLAKNLTLTSNTRYDYGKLDNNVTTYNRDGNHDYDKINPALSSSFSRESHRVSTGLGLELKIKKLTITPTVRGLWQKVDNSLASLPSPIKQNRFDVLPALSVVYKQLNLSYDKNIALPYYNYLIPVVNNSNPYYVVKGNPNLLPAERHNFSANYYTYNAKKNLNIGLNMWGSYANKEIVQSIVVDDKGIQTTTPVNADGSSSGAINFNINKQYKLSNNRSISWNTGGYYSLNRNRLLYNYKNSWQNSWSLEQWSGFGFNLNDKVEWRNSYSFGYSFTTFTNDAFKNLNAVQHFVSTELTLHVPKHVIWEANFNYDYNGNVPAGLPKDAARLNMAINFTMLKDEKGVLRLSVFDLLNNNNSINLRAERNTITAVQSNVLTRYFLATFTYNIRSISAPKQKKSGFGLFGF